MASNNNLKHGFGSSSHNNIISTHDKKRNDLSKEKYTLHYPDTEINIYLKIQIISILKAAQSSTSDKLSPIKIPRKLIKSFSNPNSSRRTPSFPTHNSENKYIWTCKISSPIKRIIWTKLIVRDPFLVAKERRRKIAKKIKK